MKSAGAIVSLKNVFDIAGKDSWRIKVKKEA